jgi:hypothetical protein
MPDRPVNDPTSHLDDLLDAALASYSEPTKIDEANLTTGVFARLRDEEAMTSDRRSLKDLPHAWRAFLKPWTIAWSLVALALVITGVLIMKISWSSHVIERGNLKAVARPNSALPPTNVQAHSHLPQAIPARGTGKSRGQASVKEGRFVPIKSAAPELNVFPTPSPLSPQEQILLSTANRPQPELKQTLVEQKELAQHLAEPIHIAEIEIKPLLVPDTEEQPH